ncbi:zinc finger protein ZAT4-like [Nicotiana sylvestris]|uniref:Zinc finger protein ZAT4-like n=1 Tax=Nicotiana sylvestris TaxID=4096 RepID=A0A1U7WEZ1_NICSY|nr:PREDICTED: zinc finger protein ZAT4-like [Nicotiana sylvestris]
MEEDQDLKFVCKLCNKKYPCGKSLGGYMRSHVLTNSAELDEKIEPQFEKLQSWNSGVKDSNKENQHQSKFELGGNSGYGLRENPKKSWRAVDSTSPLPQEKICQQCGKVFQSLKALCGHMACHSEKDKGTSYSDTEVEEELRLRTRSKTKRYRRIVVKSSVCLVNDNTINNGSSCVSEIDNEQDQEEVAKCLMMLSKDSWNCVTSFVESSDNNSVVLETKSSSTDMKFARKDGLRCDYNQEEMPRTKKKEDSNLKLSVLDVEVESENSDSAYFLDENTIVESDVSFDGLHRNGNSKWSTSKMSDTVWCDESWIDKEKGLNRTKRYPTESGSEYDDYRIASYFDKCESRKRTKNSSYRLELENESFKKKYECMNCKKTFSSYQALGGHRPCHKKTNAYIESINGTGENSVDAADRDDKHRETFSSRKPASAEKKIKPKKFKGHECPFCDRIFKSGQALGGHKRSHFIVGTSQNMHQSSPVKKDVDDLLDLNLPAPVEDEDDEHAHLVSW